MNTLPLPKITRGELHAALDSLLDKNERELNITTYVSSAIGLAAHLNQNGKEAAFNISTNIGGVPFVLKAVGEGILESIARSISNKLSQSTEQLHELLGDAEIPEEVRALLTELHDNMLSDIDALGDAVNVLQSKENTAPDFHRLLKLRDDKNAD